MEQNSLITNLLKDVDYYEYLVQYQGDILAEMKSYPQYKVIIINDKYAILIISKDDSIIVDEEINFSTIVYIKPPEMFTLQSISPKSASQVSFIQCDKPLSLYGDGVDIAILDTGIDYLNEEFMDDEGKTRVNLIWDQTISRDDQKYDISVPFGHVFSKEEIQSAIDAKRRGENPYNIVPSVDEIGHGTEMAGIIAASGKNKNFTGMVPKSSIIAIKLIEDYAFEKYFYSEVPVFNISIIFSALEFLYQYALKNSRPMVIYFPLGSNLGNHNGTAILDQFINAISLTTKIIVVTGTGNEQRSGCHTSGRLSENEKTKFINIHVSKEEKNLWVEIWVESPNIFSVDVISPSGESSGVVNILINRTSNYNYIFEKTNMKVNYYLPEESTGAELIRIRFYDLQPGIWGLRIIGNEIFDGQFNVWMPQRGITHRGTYFSPDDIYGTITNPGNTEITVTVAAYNQNNNTLVDYSGIAPQNSSIIDVAAGGVNALTFTSGGKPVLVNGTSVAAAIVAGACAMLLEWGVVEGNYPNMYAMTIKTYLKRGVTRRSGNIYPNSNWGYGILNIYNIFNEIN